MQNIDPVLFAQPILVIAMSVGAIWFWWRSRGFRGILLGLSAVAYAAAIAAKYTIQILTLAPVVAYFGRMSLGLGLYYGLQTVLLEVGFAYLLAFYGARRRNLKVSDSVPFGLSLAFWENGVLLGLLSLLNLSVLYLLLGSGTGDAQVVYNQLVSTTPYLFLPPLNLLPSVLIGALERVSSMLAHVAWGVLCVIAAATGNRRFFYAALPMGLIDALVPFASLDTNVFEAVVFLLSCGFLVVAYSATLSVSRGGAIQSEPVQPAIAPASKD
ncbi:MAG: YhfC family glutamic-type intramembrane protease [Nitrososphaerales archaeon]|nr:YhfC family glutamic-type intramembrane protease [Nitrososphaerales archaeon]